MAVNVLIIDDSTTVCAMLTQMLTTAGFTVVGVGKNADEGLQLAGKLKPDVITLDIEMPGKSGLQILPQLQKVCDAAVIMCSTLTNQAASATLQSLEKGAFDYIPKTEIGKSFTPDMLKERVNNAYVYVIGKRKGEVAQYKPTVPVTSLPFMAPKAIVIGVSTGGPAALHKLFTMLPVMPVPIVVVQHMPAAFVASLAERIAQQSKHKTSVAKDDHTFVPGEVCFAPGDKHVVFKKIQNRLYCDLSEEPKNILHKPSADVLFQTAAEVMGKDLLAVVLTGMGRDGADGSKTVRLRGGMVLAESKSSCVVYGMPKSVIDAKTANFEFDLQDMAAAITKIVTGKILPPQST
ncbi:chemotaxis-specific protein-glutamate methyltransferase CheB [Fluviispira vulneris]|uniref:chemotaxis-specific protein-glutamate methyltransferase CheB n=1 Tax=Fluviispira vulneris TaxID=2763012 RepID=UPI00164878AA|nr:chemotaxis-specific protein-glutamate methyltransferase CheB [Fluviispira vulneris]